jgi:hypothetical protein
VAAAGGRDVRFLGASAYVDGQFLDGDTLALMRQRYGGSVARGGFAIHLACKNRHQDATPPTGGFAGLPTDVLVAFHTFVLFITTYVATYLKPPRGFALKAVLIAAACQLFLITWFGGLTDRFGRRRQYSFDAIGAVNWVFVFLVLPHTGSFSLVVLGVVIALFYHAAVCGSQAAFVGRFPSKIRCGGTPKSFQIAGIFGQALASIICVAMLDRHDISLVVSLYVVVLAVTTAFVPLAAETSRIDQQGDLVDQRAGERGTR